MSAGSSTPTTPGSRGAIQQSITKHGGKSGGGRGSGSAGLQPVTNPNLNPDPFHRTRVQTAGVTQGYIDPAQLRLFLRHQGYDIPMKGGLDRTLKSALGDFLDPSHTGATMNAALRGTKITGTRDPHAWNQRFGTTKTRMAPDKPNGQQLDTNGNTIVPPSDTTSTDPPQQTYDETGLQKLLASDKGTPIPLSMSQYGKMIDPSTADSIAGEQFDPQIREAQLALAKDPTLAKQHAADIGSWYGQVLKSQHTAAGRDNAAYQAAVGSVGDAGKALVASLGGGANMGAGDVGAAAADATGTQAALQQAEDQYNNDLAPLLQNEKAGMLANQGNTDANQSQQDRLALENLQGQRGQAQTTAQDQITQENNALAQGRASLGENIREQNNALTQQGFNNALGLAQSVIAAQMSGLKVQDLQNKVAAANYKASNPFLSAASSVKNKAYQQALASLYDPNGQKLNLTPQQASSRVNSVLSSFGWNPVPGTPSGHFGAGIVRTWQTAG